MLDLMIEELQSKINELHKEKEAADKASFRVNPKYSSSEMKTALLALTYTLAALREAKKKSEAK